jgi:hypothetical protein
VGKMDQEFNGAIVVEYEEDMFNTPEFAALCRELYPNITISCNIGTRIQDNDISHNICVITCKNVYHWFKLPTQRME